MKVNEILPMMFRGVYIYIFDVSEGVLNIKLRYAGKNDDFCDAEIAKAEVVLLNPISKEKLLIMIATQS